MNEPLCPENEQINDEMNITLCTENEETNESKTIINVLFLGLSYSGKSTLIETIKNPSNGITHEGYSQKSKSCIYEVKFTYEQNEKLFCLNIIDTPGIENFLETGTRLCEELNTTLMDFKFINTICIILKAAYTNSEEKDKIIKFISLLPAQCSNSCMLILTHCDSISDEDLDEFENAIKEDEQTKQICSYCKCGIFRMGALDLDSIRSVKISKIQDTFKEKKLIKIKHLRKILIDKIIKCSTKLSIRIEGPFLSNFNYSFTRPIDNVTIRQPADNATIHQLTTSVERKKWWNRICCYVRSWCASITHNISAITFITISGIFFVLDARCKTPAMISSTNFINNLSLNNEYGYSQIFVTENFSSSTCYKR